MKRNADDVQVLSVTQNFDKKLPVLNSTPYFGFITYGFLFLKINSFLHFSLFVCVSG